MCIKVKVGKFLSRRIQFEVEKGEICFINFVENGEIYLSIKNILVQLDVNSFNK